MDAVEKYIVTADWAIGIVTIKVVLSSVQMINRPGTMFGLRYTMDFHLTSTLSQIGLIRWSIYVKKKDQTDLILEPVGTNEVQNHLVNGNPRAVLASGQAQVIDNTVRDVKEIGIQRQQIVARVQGSIKTSRKMQTGDELILVLIGNAVLGIQLHGLFTYWKKN